MNSQPLGPGSSVSRPHKLTDFTCDRSPSFRCRWVIDIISSPNRPLLPILDHGIETMTSFSRLGGQLWIPWTSIGLALSLVVLAGCGESTGPDADADSSAADVQTRTAPARRVSDESGAMTIEELREQLGIGKDGDIIQKVGGQIVAMDLRQTAVTNLSPLQGLPLRELYLEQTRVTDISPLQGMPLEKLYLIDTPVADLTPLAGMSIQELNLVRTAIKDVAPLKDVELGTLWLRQTKVSDLAPLAGKSLVSLDIQGTPVDDLSPLAGNESLRRLHIGETKVTDLTPLAGLKLERLVFSPDRITTGIEVIRNMTSLRQLDVALEEQFQAADVMTPEAFWTRYDAGEWPAPAATPDEAVTPDE